MSLGWDRLPLLPLGCIMEHLSTEDALAAMSTCRHWRSTILLYEGHKDTLKLRSTDYDKSVFLTNIFKKNVRNLHIYLDSSHREIVRFINIIMPNFFDTLKLNEVLFIGPSYLKQSVHFPVVKLKRVIIESLIFKHQHTLQKIVLMGCALDTVDYDKESYTNKIVETYSKQLHFNSVSSPADTIISSCNIDMIRCPALHHIIVDYDQISTQALETLSQVPTFCHLSVNIVDKKQFKLKSISWMALQVVYHDRLEVSINIIGLSPKKLWTVQENVLVPGLVLTSLKVMFCKSLNDQMIGHVAQMYKTTLRELVWVDAPGHATQQRHSPNLDPELRLHVNPFILLCWQCDILQRLVIHGYWVAQYDLLGFTRLCNTMSSLEVSAVYQKHFVAEEPERVLVKDCPIHTDYDFIQRVNKCIEFEWRAAPWEKLHPGLKDYSTPEQRADYIVKEAMNPIGVT